MTLPQRVQSAADEAHMVAIGAQLGRALLPGSVVYLCGDLGMGKTTLARGLIQSLGHCGAVKSPTYTLVEPYHLVGRTVYHFDLYRISDPEELEFMGIREYFDGDAITLIEWAELGKGFLPPADLVVTITTQGLGRRLSLRAETQGGADSLQRWSAQPDDNGEAQET